MSWLKLMIISLIATLLTGYSPAQHHELEACAYELVTEVGGSRVETAGPILAALVALKDKPADRVAAVLTIGLIESGLTRGRPGAAGEIGMFQVMPATAAWAAKQCKIDGAWHLPSVNAKLAYCYFEYQYVDSGFDLYAALAAYNAGPRAILWVKQYKSLPKVTANYLVKFNRLMTRTSCGQI